MKSDIEVLIIGSGFGASVSALRFAEAGKSVMILERGGRITRANFDADVDMLWQPEKGRYGMNDFKKRGRHIVPWLGAGVGGGSHVYAGTLKRRDFFDDFPSGISVSEMTPFYKLAEEMMAGNKYPNYAPYGELPAYRLFREAEKKLDANYPLEVEKQGDILLGISFAPEGIEPGSTFINKHGAQQRYSNPSEQKLLGGEIDVKNTLDKNYLFLAEQQGAIIHEFREVSKIVSLENGAYEVHWFDPRKDASLMGVVTCEVLISGAGAIGSTELLMQNKHVHKTLTGLSDQLGASYFTNGDYVTFLLPKKGFAISWLGFIATLIACFIPNMWLAALGLVAYLIGWAISDKKQLPDVGTTNSDYIRFLHRDGSPQGMYIEGGRYPTPIKAFTAIIMSFMGKYRPQSYGKISSVVNFMGKYVPFFELLERSWPIPLLMMGRDDAVGHFQLNDAHEAEIEFPVEKNDAYVQYLEKWGRIFSKQAKSYFIPNFVAKTFKIVEVPHNMGGCSMGDTPAKGVVDTYGRVFGYENFLVLDGSIMPCSLGPNPVSTILAFAERSMKTVIPQLKESGKITSTEVDDSLKV